MGMANAFTVKVDSMAPEGARRMASVVQPGRQTEPGGTLPLLWQWAYFPETGTQRGPRQRRSSSPARPSGLNAFPGGWWWLVRVKRVAPFMIGVPAQRRSELVSAREREGRQGGF